MFIVEAPGGADSGGRLVAGLDSEMGWVELDDDGFEPQWWSQVSERVRRWIIDRPREALPDWMIAAGVGATSPYWVSAEQSGEFYLPTGLQDWGLARRLIETYNAG